MGMRTARALLYATAIGVAVSGQAIDHAATPIVMAFASNGSIGPDGPWWYIPTSVDTPDEYMYLMPSLANVTLIVNGTACTAQNASCPLTESGVPPLWSQTQADINSNDNGTVSKNIPPAQWDSRYAALLNMSGEAQFFSNNLELYDNGNYAYDNSGDTLEYHVMAMSNSYSVGYPGGAAYTIDTGFFSLYGKEQLFTWPSTSGFEWTNNRTLPDAYINGYIPSNSYGLHVGSVYPNISGSLVLGGYDSSRVLNDPVTTSEDYFELTGIALSLSDETEEAYTAANLLPNYGQLLQNYNSSSNHTSLRVRPDPGVPYLYLPYDTCDTIAGTLPLYWESDFGLYVWATDDPTYLSLVTSWNLLKFTFTGNTNSATEIDVPLALLNLTLDTPLVSEQTKYFPCRPWTPDDGTPEDGTYVLGRSFLQAAFLGQNWNTSTMFLAQAPGPDHLPTNVKTIAYNDKSLSPATNPPALASTWAKTLNSLNGTDPNNDPGDGDNSGLSGGAIAGIVVGAVLGLAILALAALFFLRRRKRRNANKQGYAQPEELRPYFGSDGSVPPQYTDAESHMQEKQEPYMLPDNQVGHSPLVEAPSHRDPVEMDGAVHIHEMDAISIRHK